MPTLKKFIKFDISSITEDANIEVICKAISFRNEGDDIVIIDGELNLQPGESLSLGDIDRNVYDNFSITFSESENKRLVIIKEIDHNQFV